MTSAREQRLRVLGCGVLYVVLVAWAIAWPATGDGDSVLHYLGLRQTPYDPRMALTAWSRPAFVALLALPAMGGVLLARGCAAVLAVALVWQTMRMADDLELAHPALAGLFLIAQPLVFALASDTMTEIPTALAVAIAIRLWWAGRARASCVVASFLPLFRPEGFFLVPIFGGLVLTTPSLGSLRRRLEVATTLGIGMAAWMAASLVITRDPFFPFTSWPWAATNPAKFEPLPLLHHVFEWPYYCGHVLIGLFVAGIPSALRRRMLLPWLVWTVVIGVHSVLAWLGRFEDYGLMRIQAVSASTTALVCLHGWNVMAAFAERTRVPRRLRAALAAVTLAAAAVVPGYYYWATAEHHRIFALRQAAAFVREHDLVSTAPRLFVGDHLVLVELGLGWKDWQLVVPNVADRRVELPRLAALPVGSIGVWDDQQAEEWYGLTTDDLMAEGYDLLFAVSQTAPSAPRLLPWQAPPPVTQRYVVLRKRVAAVAAPSTTSPAERTAP